MPMVTKPALPAAAADGQFVAGRVPSREVAAVALDAAPSTLIVLVVDRVASTSFAPPSSAVTGSGLAQRCVQRVDDSGTAKARLFCRPPRCPRDRFRPAPRTPRFSRSARRN